MRTAIFGDIHANQPALEATLLDAHAEGCTAFACTGDLVGYGDSPNECIDIIKSLGCPVVLGNHDEAATIWKSLPRWRPPARRAMQLTRMVLTEPHRDWLRELPITVNLDGATLVHATLDTPRCWAYVTNKYDAMASFAYQAEPLCFYGHTHAPTIYRKDGPDVEKLDVTRIEIETGRKYFINVGSVGQPRDGDPRPCYAIYDRDAAAVSFKRVE